MTMPTSWNRQPRVTPDATYALTRRHGSVPSALPRPLLAHGNGRSYGDVCLTERGTLLLTRGLDRFIELDAHRGILHCEAGVTLAEVLALIVPRGWFLPCTPGTRWATVGGAVANDVHGKNHHVAGSFGHHVRRLVLWRSDGSEIDCRPEDGSGWFAATVGGLGLTGLITQVELELLPIHNPWLQVASWRFASLDAFWPLNRQAEARWPYTVAWIDCLARGKAQGRGILMAGQHAAAQVQLPSFKESRKRMPIDPPFSLVNGLTLRSFNALYYRQITHPEGQLSHYVPYFYPLDAIQHWNRIYGRRGFYQYQCVMPPNTAEAATAALLNAIARRRDGSFLAVLKTFGHASPPGMLSFARPGTTLALDFPNRGRTTQRLLADLDTIVSQAGGALYPAKDARMPASLFQAGFPRWEAFSAFIDPDFSSRFWQRVTP